MMCANGVPQSNAGGVFLAESRALSTSLSAVVATCGDTVTSWEKILLSLSTKMVSRIPAAMFGVCP